MSCCSPRIIVALDFSSVDQALVFAARLDPAQCRLKVGKELFTRGGPQLVEKLIAEGFDLFLDLKFHDIPNTAAAACRAAADLGVWMVNVHTLGGRRMMEAAREAVDAAAHRPLLIGVTILTSMVSDELHEIGLAGEVEQSVQRLARLAQQAGLDGVVCSPWEAQTLRRELGDGAVLVTPGVRPQGSVQGDQRRIMTPREALQQGSDYLVIGRPVTQAEDPLAVLAKISSELVL